METQHTPGPWAVVVHDVGNKRGLHGIGAMSVSVIVDCAYGATLDECDANTRLIAAAPELLAALQAIVDCDLSTVRTDYNGRLLNAIADAHDLLVKVGV